MREWGVGCRGSQVGAGVCTPKVQHSASCGTEGPKAPRATSSAHAPPSHILTNTSGCANSPPAPPNHPQSPPQTLIPLGPASPSLASPGTGVPKAPCATSPPPASASHIRTPNTSARAESPPEPPTPPAPAPASPSPPPHSQQLPAQPGDTTRVHVCVCMDGTGWEGGVGRGVMGGRRRGGHEGSPRLAERL